jgi:arsenite methyltransferase
MTDPQGPPEVDADVVHEAVRERYRKAADPSGSSCCGEAGSSCCGDSGSSSCCGPAEVAVQLGYSAQDLESLPEGANLGLGCGNPVGIASLRPGETVLDLGSGAGVDCFLAARRVGASGRVIGVDMTPEMISRARANARKGNYVNVEFRLGEIEHLPIEDRSVDVILSNCVVNLSPDKPQVYRDAFRVLRPGGRLAVSDVVATRPFPRTGPIDVSRWSSCSDGAMTEPELAEALRAAGFVEISIQFAPAAAESPSLEGQVSTGALPASVRAIRPRSTEGPGSS